jgi:hypothetical protein
MHLTEEPINGGSVTLNSGIIASVSGQYGVEVNKGTFDMEGGVITGNSDSYKAIEVKDGGTVTLNSGDVLGGDAEETKNVAIYGDITIEKSNTAGTVELKKGIVKGDVSVAGSAFTLTDGTVNDIKVGAAGTVNVNGGVVNTITDTAAGTAINIAGGTIGASADASTDAIAITNGTPVVVSNTATIGNEKAKTAVSITKGSLTVNGGAPVFKGAKVISAVPASASVTVSVTLSAAEAQYVGTNYGYVICNSQFATVATLDKASSGLTEAADMAITAGKFDGDVITDQARMFIKGGKFKNCPNLVDYGQTRHWLGLNYSLGEEDENEYMTVSK